MNEFSDSTPQSQEPSRVIGEWTYPLRALIVFDEAVREAEARCFDEDISIKLEPSPSKGERVVRSYNVSLQAPSGWAGVGIIEARRPVYAHTIIVCAVSWVPLAEWYRSTFERFAHILADKLTQLEPAAGAETETFTFDVDGEFASFYRSVRNAFNEMERVIAGLHLLHIEQVTRGDLLGRTWLCISVVSSAGEVFELESIGTPEAWARDKTARVRMTTHFLAEREATIRWRARWLALIAREHPEIRVGTEQHIEPVATSPQQPQYPTDPNDPRLLAAGLSPEDRALVAATNRGATVAQYVRARQGESDEAERLRLNKRLHELRKRHPELVRPAKAKL